MTIHVFGSINVDHVYRVPHFPDAGETLATTGHSVGLGGKGANQAIAAARAGADIRFVGAVGRDGEWAHDALKEASIDVAGIRTTDSATGHAIILVEPSGENRIVIHGGANRDLQEGDVANALNAADPGDWWLVQNETAFVAESMAMARAHGLRTAYAAAPFDAAIVAAVLPHTDLLFVNEGEERDLIAHLGGAPDFGMRVTTLGAAGARIVRSDQPPLIIPAFRVEPLDTTAAGDTFTGAFLASLDRGETCEQAGRFASAAAALSVTREGAAASIPTRGETERFLEERA